MFCVVLHFLFHSIPEGSYVPKEEFSHCQVCSLKLLETALWMNSILRHNNFTPRAPTRFIRLAGLIEHLYRITAAPQTVQQDNIRFKITEVELTARDLGQNPGQKHPRLIGGKGEATNQLHGYSATYVSTPALQIYQLILC